MNSITYIIRFVTLAHCIRHCEDIGHSNPRIQYTSLRGAMRRSNPEIQLIKRINPSRLVAHSFFPADSSSALGILKMPIQSYRSTYEWHDRILEHIQYE